ncbi:MAG: NADPH:quinone oxidoreductase family protein [Gammaproteobacteria bacterium AqS3]|nr:NADPH:quinone oxidoreductase family protein [Gammaproteobacteria bacterium AqS3]
MRAWLCKEYGPPEKLVLEEVPNLEPGPGQVVVNVKAVGINFPDVLIIQGLYQFKPDFPFAPGGEISGEVAALGEGVDGVQVGQRVMALVGNGGLAEQVVLDAGALMPVPDGVSDTVAAGFSMTYGTTYHALVQRAELRSGENLLVLGAAGGVGITAVELGKLLGARVIAAASSAEKLEVARRAGADEVVNYSEESLKDRVKELTGGNGADVIYDPVGGDLFSQCMSCINWKGRLLVIGFASGDIPSLAINRVLLKGCQVVGVFWGAFTGREPDRNRQNFAELFELLKAGKIDPLISETFPFERGPEAISHLGARKAVGKVVVEVA